MPSCQQAAILEDDRNRTNRQPDATLKDPGQSSSLPKRRPIFKLDFAGPPSKEAGDRYCAHVLMCLCVPTEAHIPVDA